MKNVRSYGLYCYLTEKGFTPDRILPHPDNPKKRLWVYAESKELSDEIGIFCEKVNKERAKKQED